MRCIFSPYTSGCSKTRTRIIPRTVLLRRKGSPGYYFAKEILQFIVCLADTINNDPRVNQKLRVIFVENYCVSWAELLTPGGRDQRTDLPCGYRGFRTSNMKFMINGAITLGTLDGANVEITTQWATTTSSSSA